MTDKNTKLRYAVIPVGKPLECPFRKKCGYDDVCGFLSAGKWFYLCSSSREFQDECPLRFTKPAEENRIAEKQKARYE